MRRATVSRSLPSRATSSSSSRAVGAMRSTVSMLIRNLVGSEWRAPEGAATLPVFNPATAEVIAHVPLTDAAGVDAVVRAAADAFAAWSRTAVMDRVRLMFRFKFL
ncbi:MAG: aldehyde dehydrogenase family protein, partial [Chloroflexi bacterium]